MRFFIFLGLIFLSQRAFSQAWPNVFNHHVLSPVDECHGPDIQRIQRPYFSDEPGSPTFEYAFKWIHLDDAAPTIVIIPGGPGETAIDNDVRHDPLFANFNIIATDPRGVGCNQSTGMPFPDEFYRTEYFARDILAAIGAVHTKHYILYGTSYGTELATLTAALAEKSFRPDALVLQGVLGRALAPDDYFRNFVVQWEREKTRLAPEVLLELKKDQPLGVANQKWALVIHSALYEGDVVGPDGPVDFMSQLLAPLSPQAPASDREALKKLVANAEWRPSAEVLRMLKIIWCQELDDTTPYPADFEMKNGDFVAGLSRLCDPALHLIRPYDSAQWQTSAPIYYFEGDADPATPLAGALYHRDHQLSSRRTFVEVFGGGHHGLSGGLADCAPALLQAVAHSRDVENLLSRCTLKTKVTVSMPKPERF